jgi:hypothetical protein
MFAGAPAKTCKPPRPADLARHQGKRTDGKTQTSLCERAMDSSSADRAAAMLGPARWRHVYPG